MEVTTALYIGAQRECRQSRSKLRVQWTLIWDAHSLDCGHVHVVGVWES